MHAKQTHFSSLLLLFHNLVLLFSLLAKPSSCAPDSVIYNGCTRLNFEPGTPYESNLNSVLTSLVNSSSSTNYNSKSSHSGSKQNDTVYGLFQCRGDMSNSDCRSCVATAVSQLGNSCGVATGGVIQLDGCFVRYDNVSFVGVDDKKVVVDNCGPSIGLDSGTLSQRESVLTSLTNQRQYFRVSGSGNVQGVAQCTQDLSVTQCQDCLLDAIGRLRGECGSSSSGDVFLSKCYARFSETGFQTPTKPGIYDNHYNHDDNDDDDNHLQRTLAIIVAAIVGVALFVWVVSVWSRHMDKKYGK